MKVSVDDYEQLYAKKMDNLEEMPAMQETWVLSLCCEDSLEEAWQCTPVFLPGESPWTEEPGKLQTMGLQSVGHD